MNLLQYDTVQYDSMNLCLHYNSKTISLYCRFTLTNLKLQYFVCHLTVQYHEEVCFVGVIEAAFLSTSRSVARLMYRVRGLTLEAHVIGDRMVSGRSGSVAHTLLASQ